MASDRQMDIVKRLRTQASNAPRELVMEAAEKIAWLRLDKAETVVSMRKEITRLTEELKRHEPELVEPDWDPGDDEDFGA